ncbi:MAG: hypothetical protein V1720_02540 [bacterium]
MLNGIKTFVHRIKYFHLIIICLFLFKSINVAQISNTISNVEFPEAKEGQPLELNVTFRQVPEIEDVNFFYKLFNDVDYHQIEMELLGTVSKIIIPAEHVLSPTIEYYISILFTNGSVETYPLSSPDEVPPLQIKVEPRSPKDDEIIVLSPLPGEKFDQSDLLISFSLLRCSPNVKKEQTKIWLDGIDINNHVIIDGDIVSVDGAILPVSLNNGNHVIKIELFDLNGVLYHSYKTIFEIISGRSGILPSGLFTYKVDLQAESRREDYAGSDIWYNNFLGNITGNYSDWEFGLNLYITSEEKKYLQPQNRYQVKAGNDWMKISIGDAYPRYPYLIMNGKRIRGFDVELDLNFLKLNISFGETRRQIEGQLLEIIKGDSVLLESNVISIDSMRYGSSRGRVDFGTYSRTMFAIRPAFFISDNINFGFSYLHSEDNDEIEFGSNPEENALAGFDFNMGFDRNNIQIKSEAAFSLYNSNITHGTLSDSQIDSLFNSGSFFDYNTDDLKQIKNLLGGIITFNQFFHPLNPGEFSTFAGESEIKLNYYNNNLRFKYLYRGSGFKSFGQEFLRTDVKGFSITDQFNLFEEGLFFNLGYERLEDNLQNSKTSTTTFQTINSSISYFPKGDLPGIVLGFTRYFNKNDIESTDSSSANYLIDNSTNRIRIQVSHKFNYLAENNVSLSYSTSVKSDNSIINSDGNNSLVNLSLMSKWSSIFSSYFNGVVYQSDVAGNKFDYSGISLGGKFILLENMLNISAFVSPSFGDLKRQTFEMTAEYFVNQQISLLLQTRFFKITGDTGNSIIGLILRTNI